MDKNYIRKLLDIIHADVITMNGGKGNLKTSAILLLLVVGLLGFCFDSFFFVMIPLVLGLLFVPMLFQNEIKYHSQKMYCVFPVRRKDIVRSRYILCIGVYLIVSIIFYLFALLAMKLRINYIILGNDADSLNTISMISKQTDGILSGLGLYTLIYIIVLQYGLVSMTSILRKYFRNSSSIENLLSGVRKSGKEDIILGAGVFLILGLILLIITDVLPIGNSILMALFIILQLVSQLAQVADGLMLDFMVITFAVFTVIYSYICTVNEYERKEI